MAVHDIIVVSDLHLGRGKNPETGRYYRLEAFFYDEDFFRFCDFILEQARREDRDIKLVLNGDAFDLLRVDHDRVGDESLRERRYGPVLTPALAAETMQKILAGHPRFVDALGMVLASGHQVVFTPGNHDPEVQWPCVQKTIRAALIDSVGRLAGDETAKAADELLVFEDWFHYEPGRIWIEHGNQYDEENSFRYNLRRGLEELPDPVHKAEKDLPLGTFFQKYLYNGFGSITFIVPNSRSNFRYFRWLLLNRPRLVAKVATGQIPFFLQVMRRIAKSATSAEELKECHEGELEELAESSKLGEALREIDGYKRVHAASAMLAERIIIRTFKIAVFALLGALLVTAVWFVGFHTINQMQTGFGLKALLFLALNFLFMIAAVSGVGYLLLRPPGDPPDPHAESSARKIAKLLDVPMVTFGHTHEEVISRLKLGDDRKAWYYNTGTWIAVFTNDQLLPRERVQYTYLHVRENEAELLHWSPGRGEPVPVILLEVDEMRQGESDKPAGAPVG